MSGGNKAELVKSECDGDAGGGEQYAIVMSMTNDESVKTNCIFRNRTDRDASNDDKDDDDDRDEVEAAIRDGKNCIMLCLDRYSCARQIILEEHHRKLIIDALIKIQLATKKIIRRLTSSQLPAKDKKNLINKFQSILNCVDKYLEEIVRTRAGELATPTLYMRIYQLEAQYNLYQQRHIDISTAIKNKQGLAHLLIKWLCFFCY